MHTLSTRALAALAFDRDQEFDPGQPLSAGMLEDLELVIGARAIVTEISPADRHRRSDRARRQRLAAVPDWFSVDDLVAAPWETAHDEPV